MSQLYEQSCCSSLMKGCLVFLDQIPYPLWVARVRKAIAARTDVDIPDDLVWNYYKSRRTVEYASAMILNFLTDPMAPQRFSSYPLWVTHVRAALAGYTELDVTDAMARMYYNAGHTVEDAAAEILRILEETPWRAKPPADGPTVLIGFPYPRRFFVWEPKEDITPYELAQAMPFLFRLNEDPLARPYDLTTLGTSAFRHFRFEIG